MLELEQIVDHEEPSCKYYFVDHVKRAVFWLEHTNITLLHLPPLTSVSYLSTSSVRSGHHKTRLLILQRVRVPDGSALLEPLEFFSMHITLPASVEEELIAILSYATIGEFGPTIRRSGLTWANVSHYSRAQMGCVGSFDGAV
jgi:hypothetical protein